MAGLPPLRVRWRRGRPLRINDLIMIDAEKGRDLCQGLGLDIAASD
jgi:hypothetical protein